MPAVTAATPKRATALWAKPAHPRARRPASPHALPASRSSATTARAARHGLCRALCAARECRAPCRGCRVGQGVRARCEKSRCDVFLRLSDTSTPAARSTLSAVSAKASESRQPAYARVMQSVHTGRSARSASRRKASRSPAVRYLRIPPAVCSCMPVCGAGVGALMRPFWALARETAQTCVAGAPAWLRDRDGFTNVFSGSCWRPTGCRHPARSW
jgi:hypothetical protein